ncbi:UpxY family transcription antiterminator [Hallella seregens]|uniref:UpxY family transcription antiterminator n=1 Tax=Hallella seregens ATCC 51272 TaxID=1336250 RepID=A0ABV5ZHU3_9BACT|nr:UpxY family transcription antiterminator [Hallella seregens]
MAPHPSPDSSEEALLPAADTGMQDDRPWYALRLFTLRQSEVAEHLKSLGLDIYIPMEYRDREDRTHHIRHELRPVVHNLIFIRKTMEEEELRTLLHGLDYKMAVIRKSRDRQDYCEIPAHQMQEFQAMCNPDILMKRYLSQEQARLKAGTPVRVTHGPLRGLQGKLVRSNKHYFLLKEIPGMAVMLKVTRWCCQPIGE